MTIIWRRIEGVVLPIAGVVLLHFGVVIAQEPEASNQVLCVPERLSGLRFGDPVFVPISIRNTTDKIIVGYSLQDRYQTSLGVRVKASSGQSELLIDLDPASDSPGYFEHRDGSTIESRVLLICLWTPSLIRQVAITKKCKLTFDVGPENRPDYKSLSDQVILEFEGSAFARGETEEITDATWESQFANVDRVSGCNWFAPFSRSMPFWSFATPMYLTKIGPRISRDQFDQFDLRIDPELVRELILTSQSTVEEDSKLYRMHEFAELFSFAAKSKVTLSDWTEMLPEFSKLIDKCTPLEAEYYIALVSADRTHGLPEESRQVVTDALLQAFPTYSDLIVGERPRVRTTRMVPPRRCW